MNKLIDQLIEAQKYAMSVRPEIGGFPTLAEALRTRGILFNKWTLPSCQSIYVFKQGSVVQQGTPLVLGNHEVPAFNREALIHALRTDQAGKSTFPEFLMATWRSGVIGYDVDFEKRSVHYFGANGESYFESYPAVEL